MKILLTSFLALSFCTSAFATDDKCAEAIANLKKNLIGRESIPADFNQVTSLLNNTLKISQSFAEDGIYYRKPLDPYSLQDINRAFVSQIQALLRTNVKLISTSLYIYDIQNNCVQKSE